MDVVRMRRISRVGVGIGALCFVVGGLLIWQSLVGVGDFLMVFGGFLLLVSAIFLSRTPPGGTDAG